MVRRTTSWIRWGSWGFGAGRTPAPPPWGIRYSCDPRWARRDSAVSTGRPPGGAIGLVDLTLAQAEVVTGVRTRRTEWWRGVGVTYDSGHAFILRDSTETAGEWQQFTRRCIHTDTVPNAVRNTFNGGDVARLSASVWLHWGPHSAAVVPRQRSAMVHMGR